MFAGEAYNVEMGISNQLFPQERDETPGCLFNPTPNDTAQIHDDSLDHRQFEHGVISDIEAFANFMRMLAPPTPAPSTPATENGRAAICTDRLCPLPYAFIHHGQNDRERLLDQSECCAFQSNGESLL